MSYIGALFQFTKIYSIQYKGMQLWKKLLCQILSVFRIRLNATTVILQLYKKKGNKYKITGNVI